MKMNTIFIRAVSFVIAVSFLWSNAVWAGGLSGFKLAAPSQVTALVPVANALVWGEQVVKGLSSSGIRDKEAFYRELAEGRLTELAGVPVLVFSDKEDPNKLAYYAFSPSEYYFSRITTHPDVDDSLWRFMQIAGMDQHGFGDTKSFEIKGGVYYQGIFALSDEELVFINSCIRKLYPEWGMRTENKAIEKTALIFGMGLVGRGHLAYNLQIKNRYKLIFVDNNEQLVNEAKKNGSYTISMGGQKHKISDFEAYHVAELESKLERIKRINIIFVSIGATRGIELAEPLRRIIRTRFNAGIIEPLNIIFVENYELHTEVLEELRDAICRGESGAFREYFEKYVSLAEAIDEIIISDSPEGRDNPLDIISESGKFPVQVDKNSLKGEFNLELFEPIGDIAAYRKEKLFLHNQAHAALAYLAYAKGYSLLNTALKDDEEIQRHIRGAMEEAARALSNEYGSQLDCFKKDKIGKHIETLMKRFAEIQDTVVRVGREPLRKLREKDRLIGAAVYCRENGVDPTYIYLGIASAVLYAYKNKRISQEQLRNIISILEKHDLIDAMTDLTMYRELGLSAKLMEMLEEFYLLILVERLKMNGDINFWDMQMKRAGEMFVDTKSIKILFHRGINEVKTLRFNIPSRLLIENWKLAMRYITVSIYDTAVCEGAENIVVFCSDSGMQDRITESVKRELEEKYRNLSIYANFGNKVSIMSGSNFKLEIRKRLPLRDILPEPGGVNVGVDIGGTNIKIVIMKGKNVIYRNSFPVEREKGGTWLKEKVIEYISQSLEQGRIDRIDAIGISFPSPIERKKDGTVRVVRLTNYERYWSQERGGAEGFGKDYEAVNEIETVVRDKFKPCAVAIMNDADAFGYWEIVRRNWSESEEAFEGTKVILPIGTGPGYVKVKDGVIEDIPNQGGHMIIDMSNGAEICPGCETKGCYGGYVPASAVALRAKRIGIDISGRDRVVPMDLNHILDLLSDMGEHIAMETAKIYNVTGADEVILAGGITQGRTGQELVRYANSALRRRYPALKKKVSITLSQSNVNWAGAMGAAQYANIHRQGKDSSEQCAPTEVSVQMKVSPDKVVIDSSAIKDLLKIPLKSDIESRRIITGYIVSIYAALKDWQLAAEEGKEQVDETVYQRASRLLDILREYAGEIRENTRLGMTVLVDLLTELSVLNKRLKLNYISSYILASAIQSKMPKETRQAGGELLVLAVLIMAYLYRDEYDISEFNDLRELIKALGLFSSPGDLGITKEMIIGALRNVKSHSGKYTYFDSDKYKDLKRDDDLLDSLYEVVFGSRTGEIDRFMYKVSQYVSNSVREMCRHIKEKVIPHLEADRTINDTKRLIDALMETKGKGGTVILNAAGRVGEAGMFFLQRLNALGYHVIDLREITPEYLMGENDLVLNISGSGKTLSIVNNLSNIHSLRKRNKYRGDVFSITAHPEVDTWENYLEGNDVVIRIPGRSKDDFKLENASVQEWLPLSSSFEYSVMLYLEGVFEVMAQYPQGTNEGTIRSVLSGLLRRTGRIRDDLINKIKDIESKTAEFVQILEKGFKDRDNGKVQDRVPAIFLFGMGQNNYVARLFARRLQNMGMDVFVPGPRDIVSRARSGDIAIFISNSGERHQMMQKMAVAKEYGLTRIVITAAPESTLAKEADLVLGLFDQPTGKHTAEVTGSAGEHKRIRQLKRAFELTTMFYLEGISVALMKEFGVEEGDLRHVPKAWEISARGSFIASMVSLLCILVSYSFLPIPVYLIFSIISGLFFIQAVDLSGLPYKVKDFITGKICRTKTEKNALLEIGNRLISFFKNAENTNSYSENVAYVKNGKVYVNKRQMARRPKILQYFYAAHEAAHLLVTNNTYLGLKFHRWLHEIIAYAAQLLFIPIFVLMITLKELKRILQRNQYARVYVRDEDISQYASIFQQMHQPLSEELTKNLSSSFRVANFGKISLRDILGRAKFKDTFTKLFESENVVMEYDKRLNIIRIKVFGDDKDKVKAGIDNLLIIIRLTEDSYIKDIDFLFRHYSLSPSKLSLLFRKTGFDKEFALLSDIIRKQFVLPEPTEEIELQEQVADSDMGLSTYEEKASKGLVDEELIRSLSLLRYSKSQEIRRKALKILRYMKDRGFILGNEWEKTTGLFFMEDIKEDLRHIEREMRNNQEYIKDTFKNLFDKDVTLSDMYNSEVSIRYMGRGWNKQIYQIKWKLSSGETYTFVISIIRDAQLGQGDFSKGRIDSSLKNWRKLSETGMPYVPKLGAAAWIKDYRPKTVRSIGDSYYKCVENNMQIVSREFVRGVTLEEVFFDKTIPDEEKNKAKISALNALIGIWKLSRDENGRGIFMTTPKPNDIVVSRGSDEEWHAKVIDLDILEGGITDDKIIKIFSLYSWCTLDEVERILSEKNSQIIEGPTKSPIGKRIQTGVEYTELEEWNIRDGNLVSPQLPDGKHPKYDKINRGMLEQVLGGLADVYGPGFLAVVDKIKVGDNITRYELRDTSYEKVPYASLIEEDGKTVLLLDVDAFQNEQLLYLVLEHGFRHSIVHLLPGVDTAAEELFTNFMTLKTALDKGIRLTDGEIKELGADEQFLLALKILQDREEVTDEQILAVAIEHMRGMPYYAELFKEFSFAGKWQRAMSEIQDARARYEAALSVFNDIEEAKRAAKRIKEVKQRTDGLIEGLSRSINKVRMIEQSRVSWELDFADALVNNNKYIMLDRAELAKLEKRYIREWIEGITAGRKKSPFIYSDEPLPEGVGIQDVIYLVEPANVKKGMPQDRLYLPLPYSISSIYLAQQVVLAGGNAAGITDGLALNTIRVLYAVLLGRDITDEELNQLFKRPWTILPDVTSITGTLNALRRQMAQIEQAA